MRRMVVASKPRLRNSSSATSSTQSRVSSPARVASRSVRRVLNMFKSCPKNQSAASGPKFEQSLVVDAEVAGVCARERAAELFAGERDGAVELGAAPRLDRGDRSLGG